MVSFKSWIRHPFLAASVTLTAHEGGRRAGYHAAAIAGGVIAGSNIAHGVGLAANNPDLWAALGPVRPETGGVLTQHPYASSIGLAGVFGGAAHLVDRAATRSGLRRVETFMRQGGDLSDWRSSRPVFPYVVGLGLLAVAPETVPVGLKAAMSDSMSGVTTLGAVTAGVFGVTGAIFAGWTGDVAATNPYASDARSVNQQLHGHPHRD